MPCLFFVTFRLTFFYHHPKKAEKIKKKKEKVKYLIPKSDKGFGN